MAHILLKFCSLTIENTPSQAHVVKTDVSLSIQLNTFHKVKIMRGAFSGGTTIKLESTTIITKTSSDFKQEMKNSYKLLLQCK